MTAPGQAKRATTPAVVKVTDLPAAAPPAAQRSLPPSIGQCLFRSCDWTLINPASTPTELVDERVAAHLLTHHEDALRILGRIAEEADLL